MSIPGQEIKLEYDRENGDCHAIMEPAAVIGLGTTHHEALEDLREAAHFLVDTIIDLKMQGLDRGVTTEGGE